jgi:hypothetical protein
MKKFIVAILAILYLGSSTGATVYMHYCMGNFANWGLGHNESKTCGKCGMDKKDSKDNGCCKDEHKFFKDDSAQKITENSLQYFHLLTAVLPSTFIELTKVNLPSLTEASPISHSPPLRNDLAVYIRNCNFRI